MSGLSAKPEFLGLPPKEAVEHFRAKDLHVGFDWRDTAESEHLSSFTVAKAMRLDVLTTIRDAVDEAIAEGATLEQFHTRLEPILRKKEWWGRGKMIDPATGDLREVQLGSARRLETIFNTNLRMSYAKGRWERIERTAASAPYLRYVATLDNRTRPEHRKWHGTILPWDHPFWQSHYPPCGWGCRCTAIQMSDEDLEEFDLKPSAAPPADWDKTRPWYNPRLDRTVMVPVGIDPGFQHNVGLLGRLKAAEDVLEEKIAAAPADLAKAAEEFELDDWISEGRAVRERLVDATGGPDAPGFAAAFRAGLSRRLAAERGTGEVVADIGETPGGEKAAQRLRAAAKVLPESWVRAGNRLPVVGIRDSKRGSYWMGSGNKPAEITLDEDAGTPLHEYAHHLQRAMPELDSLFHQVHRRRTAGEPRIVVGPKKHEIGRKDDYVRAYAGREYDPGEEPREVFAMALQQLFHPIWGKDYLGDMARDDPEMLDLIVGVLLRYDP